MTPTNSQLRRIEELAARLLTTQGADQLIRALLVIDGGLNRDDRKLDADDTLIAAIRPHSTRGEAPTSGPTLDGILRDARETLCVNQVDAAKRIGVRQTTYSQWETGRTVPPLSRLEALSRVLGVPERVLTTARERAVAGRRA